MALGSYHNITHVLTIQKGQHYYTPAVVPMYTLHTSHTCINYSIAYPKPQNKRVLLGYCWHFVSLKPSKNHICYTRSIAVQLLCTLLNRTQVYSSITLPRLALSSITLHIHNMTLWCKAGTSVILWTGLSSPTHLMSISLSWENSQCLLFSTSTKPHLVCLPSTLLPPTEVAASLPITANGM